ncbi:MAG: UTP--glucose-1-phosphate uridylyltransferase, partial [Lentisphaeria bacterium]|nr:UTP--glucose-1-phosphate uridylyltransferase [Lentisphaeria bacterium]
MNWNEILVKYGQEHLLRALEQATAEQRAKLETQLSGIDFEELQSLIREYVLQKPVTEIPADLAPAPFFPLKAADPAQEEYYRKACEEGRKLLREGQVAFLVVAGGQGTRLGFDGPKGTYPICPVTGKSLFGYFAERIKRVSEKYGRDLPWYIMTSELNDCATKNFFAENDYFGLAKKQVRFFTQGTMPAISRDGRILLNAPDSLALSPNGHGGTLLALKRSGALEEMKREGVKYISYFQVDNPLAPFTDLLFLGLHALENSDMSARMLPKTNAFEKLGNFCVSGGKLHIIEYSDMPDEMAQKTNEDGALAFLSGSPAIHVISRDFVEKLTSGNRLNLPWHRADKKVPYLNEKMELVQVEEPNAVKLEYFIFDAIPLAEK